MASTTQELDNKLFVDEVLLRQQSGQVEKIQTTLGEIQTTQSALVNVMEKIQNYVTQDGDQDETTSVDKKPSISESTLSHAGSSREPLGRPDTAYGRLTLGAVSLVKTFVNEIGTPG